MSKRRWRNVPIYPDWKKRHRASATSATGFGHGRLRGQAEGGVMDIRAPEQQYNPYRIFSREQWARLRDDTPMTLEPGEFDRLRSLHDRTRQEIGRAHV